MVIRFPLILSTTKPVEIRLEDKLLTLSVNVFPVAIKLELTELLLLVKVCTVVI